MDAYDFFEEYRECNDGTKVMLLNYLFGEPLYGWYVIEIEVFEPGDIEGTLMTPPFQIYGPYVTEADARDTMSSLMDSRIEIDEGPEIS